MRNREGREWRARGGAAPWVQRTRTPAGQVGSGHPRCPYETSEAEKDGGRGIPRAEAGLGFERWTLWLETET